MGWLNKNIWIDEPPVRSKSFMLLRRIRLETRKLKIKRLLTLGEFKIEDKGID